MAAIVLSGGDLGTIVQLVKGDPTAEQTNPESGAAHLCLKRSRQGLI